MFRHRRLVARRRILNAPDIGKERVASPSELWRQADREHPRDTQARRKRYMELMRGAGHIVPGPAEPFACGYDPRADR